MEGQSETSPSIISDDADWDYPPLTEEDLQTIDAAFLAATSSSAPPTIRKREVVADDSHSPDPKMRRRLPNSLFSSFSACSSRTRRLSTYRSPLQGIKFGGRILYSKTVEEVERAAEELLNFVEATKRKESQCILGLDIEWKPTFRRGVAPGKAAVMQICGDNNRCHVFHIIYSGIPKTLQCLLEDPSCLKVGLGISNDAVKVLKDYNVSVKNLGDLSDLANEKLSEAKKKWSLSTLAETLICRQLPKPNNIRKGNWEVDGLSKEQLNYAATDAYISWYLYEVLRNLPDRDDTKSVETVVPPC